MSRFYFHLKSDSHYIPDTDGKDLPSLYAAQEHAFKLIDKIILHCGDDASDNWRVRITDDQSGVELIVPFSCVYRQERVIA